MKAEIVESPKRKSRSNPNWLAIIEKFDSLIPGQCVRVTELSHKELNALRQQAKREVGARSFQKVEKGKPVLYLYKKQGKGGE